MRRKFLIFFALLISLAFYPTSRAGSFSFEDLTKIIEERSPKSLEETLSLIPKDYLSNFTLVYNSNSLQQASPLNPRAVVFGSDGRFVMTFNGDPSHRGYISLETIQFREEDLTFEFRHINFENGKATISEKNPAVCTACHGKILHPIWQSYRTWSGVYGSHDDSVTFVDEAADFKTFTDRMPDHPRYRFLSRRLDISRNWPYRYTDAHIGRPNHRLGNFLANLWGRAIAHKIISSKFFQKYPKSTLLWLNSLGFGQCDSSQLRKRIDSVFEKRFPQDQFPSLYQQLELVPDNFDFPFIKTSNNVLTFKMEKLLLDSNEAIWDMIPPYVREGVHFSPGMSVLEELAAGKVFQAEVARDPRLKPFYGRASLKNWFDTRYLKGYFDNVANPYGIAQAYEETGFFLDFTKARGSCGLLERESAMEK